MVSTGRVLFAAMVLANVAVLAYLGDAVPIAAPIASIVFAGLAGVAWFIDTPHRWLPPEGYPK